jgi:hypothetical protein
MFQGEQLVVAVTHMTHTEVDIGAVGGGTSLSRPSKVKVHKYVPSMVSTYLESFGFHFRSNINRHILSSVLS